MGTAGNGATTAGGMEWGQLVMGLLLQVAWGQLVMGLLLQVAWNRDSW